MANHASDIFQLKVTLKVVTPKVWRRIQVPANYNFKQLHLVIQDAMGWHNSHLYAFRLKDPMTCMKIEIGVPDTSGWKTDIISGESVLLTSYFLTENVRAVYEYDFGNNWEHNLLLEKILPAVKGENYPKCIGGNRACPPENCGGGKGYDKHVKIVSNIQHLEYKEHMKWLDSVGGATDPEFFDPKAIEFKYLAGV